MWFINKKIKILAIKYKNNYQEFLETYDEEKSFQLHKNTLWTGKIYRIRSQQNFPR